MSKYVVIVLSSLSLIIGILLYFNKEYKAKLDLANKQVSVLELQNKAILKEHQDLAELYLNISNRVRTVKFDTLQETLRLEEAIDNSEPDSDLHKWSNQTLPREVKEVMSNMGRLYDSRVKDKSK